MDKVLALMEDVGRYLTLLKITDFLDVAIIFFLVYKLLSLVKSTRAENILKGIGIFLLALRVQKVAESSEEEKKLAQKQLRTSYFGRIMLMVFAIVVGVIAPFFNYISTLVPFLLPQPVLMLRRAIVTRREKQQKEAEY